MNEKPCTMMIEDEDLELGPAPAAERARAIAGHHQCLAHARRAWQRGDLEWAAMHLRFARQFRWIAVCGEVEL